MERKYPTLDEFIAQSLSEAMHRLSENTLSVDLSFDIVLGIKIDVCLFECPPRRFRFENLMKD
jgi:hypothetical protein